MDTDQPSDMPPPPPLVPQKSGMSTTAIVIIAVVAVLIIGVAILAAIAFPATAMVMNQARVAQAEQDVRAVVSSIKSYEIHYGILPTAGSNDESDTPTDSKLIDILSGHDNEYNPKEMPFLEGKRAQPARAGKPARGGFVDEGDGSLSLVDPWGNFYVVRLDLDGDGQIKVPGRSKPVEASVACWSYGKPPNRKDHASAKQNDPSEFITSW